MGESRNRTQQWSGSFRIARAPEVSVLLCGRWYIQDEWARPAWSVVLCALCTVAPPACSCPPCYYAQVLPAFIFMLLIICGYIVSSSDRWKIEPSDWHDYQGQKKRIANKHHTWCKNTILTRVLHLIQTVYNYQKYCDHPITTAHPTSPARTYRASSLWVVLCVQRISVGCLYDTGQSPLDQRVTW